ncbi:Kinesin-like protein, partial [Globisporangium splendens]
MCTRSFGSNPPRVDEEYDYEKANFEIHEDAQGNVFMKDLAMVTVSSREEVDALVQSGLKLCATHETKMDAVSSRSHTVFTIRIFQQKTGEVIYGMLNMVDLAGSERLKKSESDSQRLKEALHINSSLSAVGKVVMSLDPESGYNYIPYRGSKLTRLLQNSIGEERQLLYDLDRDDSPHEGALRRPRVNHINGSVADKDRRIRKLQDELSVLRRQLEGLRTEYNNKFVLTLNELGFDAEEITETGDIKFAASLEIVLRSMDAVLLLRIFLQLGKLRISRSSRRREKRMDEAKKDKEASRKALTDQRRRTAVLEDNLVQKTKEYERALASEEAKHRAEIKELLSRNPHSSSGSQEQTLWKRSASIGNMRADPAVDESKKREQQNEQVVENGQRSGLPPKNILADSTKRRHLKALVATDTNKHLQHFDCAHVYDDGKLVRPVSAPARRSKTTTYPSVLRDRVNQTVGSSDAEETIFSRSHTPTKSCPSISQTSKGPLDVVEFNRIKSLLEEEVRVCCTSVRLQPNAGVVLRG